MNNLEPKDQLEHIENIIKKNEIITAYSKWYYFYNYKLILGI